MRGRRPTPLKLKLLRGNPGRRRLNKREPQPPAAKFACPRNLGKYGAQEWHRIVPQLEALGMLTAMDAGPLLAICLAYQRARKAEDLFEADGLIEETPLGKRKHPAVNIARESWAAYKTFLVEYGITPASRARVVAPAPAEPDETEKFLGLAPQRPA